MLFVNNEYIKIYLRKARRDGLQHIPDLYRYLFLSVKYQWNWSDQKCIITSNMILYIFWLKLYFLMYLLNNYMKINTKHNYKGTKENNNIK